MNPPHAASPSVGRTAARPADGDAVGIDETSSAGRRVLVIGGGIGGLSAALCLASVGAEVLVFEAAAEIAELGVGLNVQPAAVGVLAELGLLAALDAVGVRTAELLLMTRRGQLVLRQQRGLAAGAAHPQLSVRRGHLQRVLLARDCPTWLPGRSTSATVSAPSRTPASAPLRCSTSTAGRGSSRAT